MARAAAIINYYGGATNATASAYTQMSFEIAVAAAYVQQLQADAQSVSDYGSAIAAADLQFGQRQGYADERYILDLADAGVAFAGSEAQAAESYLNTVAAAGKVLIDKLAASQEVFDKADAAAAAVRDRAIAVAGKRTPGAGSGLRPAGILLTELILGGRYYSRWRRRTRRVALASAR